MATGAFLALAEVLSGAGGTLAAPARPALVFAGVSIDSRTVAAGELFFAIRGPRFDGHDFLAEARARGAAAAVVHRDVLAPAGLPLIRVADTTGALAELARHVRRRSGVPVVGVTGSVGKTTTKDMAAHLVATRGAVLKTEGNLNNRYGLPLTLLRLRPDHATAVLEMGISAPGELRTLTRLAEPDVAVLTKVAPVHLEFFASVDAIADAKAEILEGLRPGGSAILNGDDPRLVRVGERWGGRVVWFGRDRRFDVSAEDLTSDAFGQRFRLRIAGRTADVELPLAGPHFVTDFLAAAAAAHVLGVPLETTAWAATFLTPARHRGEVLHLGGGVTLLDDCYNSSPEALEAALTALFLVPATRRVAVLGDMLELGPTGPALHRERGRTLAGRADLVIGVGPLAKEILAGALEAGLPSGALHHLEDATAAVAVVPALARAGDAVLVKGSRGMKLEVVVDALVARLGRGEA